MRLGSATLQIAIVEIRVFISGNFEFPFKRRRLPLSKWVLIKQGNGQKNYGIVVVLSSIYGPGTRKGKGKTTAWPLNLFASQ